MTSTHHWALLGSSLMSTGIDPDGGTEKLPACRGGLKVAVVILLVEVPLSLSTSV